jgi:hypothetical protein
MVIFHSYVSLPEVKWFKHVQNSFVAFSGRWMQQNEIPAARINSTLGFRYLMEYYQPTDKFQSSGIISHVQTRLRLGLRNVNMLYTKKTSTHRK